MSNENEWSIQCSDEELCDDEGSWQPSSEEVVNLYTLIEKGGPFTLNWKSPGYRSPSPATPTTTPSNDEIVEEQPEENSDFDFKDEMSSPSLRKRREGETELKGSAKKKTTSLDGVLSNMRRHWRLQQMEKDSPTDKKSTT